MGRVDTPRICALALAIACLLRRSIGSEASDEVWVVDQGDNYLNGESSSGGGLIYIFQQGKLDAACGGCGVLCGAAVAEAEVVDLSEQGLQFCVDATGTVPIRPHMLFFNNARTHALLAYVVSGHVQMIDVSTRTVVACIDVGEQNHASWPFGEDGFALVSNLKGKLLQRLRTDYIVPSLVLEDEATIDLANCTTHMGNPCQDPEVRPDNAPICATTTNDGQYGFVTLRGGGLLVVDVTTTPMQVVAEYDNKTISANGCGTIQSGETFYTNSGGANATNGLRSELYAFPAAGPFHRGPNEPAATVVYQSPNGNFDLHGMTAVGPYLWTVDRAADYIVVLDSTNNEIVSFIGMRTMGIYRPAGDLIDVSSDGSTVYVSTRGINPLSGPSHSVVGAEMPGMAIIEVLNGGRSGQLLGIVPLNDTSMSDPHAIRVLHG